MKHVLSFICVISLIFSCMAMPSNAAEPVTGDRNVKIALVGDSLTAGYINDAGNYSTTDNYGKNLEKLLSRKTQITNFSKTNAGLCEQNNVCYSATSEFKASQKYNPDIVVCMIGTTDASEALWDDVKGSYKDTLKSFLQSYADIPSKPEIIFVLPTPVFPNGEEFAYSQEDLSELRSIITDVAKEMNITTVDAYTPFKNRASSFPDGVHFNKTIAVDISTIVAEKIKSCNRYKTIAYADISKDEAITKNEYSNSAPESVATIINQLGFSQGNTSLFVTRAEYAKMLVNMLGAMPDSSDDNPFTDIDSSHMDYPYMKSAYNLGILSGGNAAPGSYVTCDQAVKMTVCALGYDVYAKAKGGYPVGYNAVASEKKLLKGTNISGTEQISRDDAYLLFANALRTDIFDIESVGSDNVVYNTVTGDNPLKRYHNISVGEGILQGVYSLNTLPGVDLSENSVIIDNHVFKTDITGTQNFVGFNVEYYYNTDTNTLCAICPVEAYLHTIDAENVEEFKNNVLTAFSNDKKISYSFSADTRIIYNGEAIQSFSPADFMGKSGEIKLVDNNRDNKIDTAFVYSYKICVVGGVDSYNGIVYDLYSSENNINFGKESEDKKVIFADEDGKRKSVSELVYGDVISYTESKSGNIITAYYSNTEIQGKIESIKTVGDFYEIIINSDVYTASPAFMENNNITPGISGVFRVGRANTVAYFRPTNEFIHFAYVLGAKKESGLSDKAMIKLYESNGEINIYDFSDKVIIDGETKSGAETAELLKEKGEIIRQPLVYKLSIDGKINYVDTIKRGVNEDENTLTRHFSAYYDEYGNQRSELKLEYRTIGMFGGKIAINNGTNIFRIPKEDDAPDNKYGILSMNYFQHTWAYPVEAYKINAASHVADILVYKYDAFATGSVPNDSPVMVVSDFAEAIDPETGDEILKIYASKGKEIAEFIVPDKTVLNVASLHDSTVNYTLSKGDIVKYDTDDFGNISAIEPIYEFSTNTFKYPSGESTSYLLDYFRMVRGEVYSMSEGIIQLKKGSIEGDNKKYSYESLETYKLNQYNIFVYDTQNTKSPLRLGGASDIVTYTASGKGSEVFIYSRSGLSGTIIIYK